MINRKKKGNQKIMTRYIALITAILLGIFAVGCLLYNPDSMKSAAEEKINNIVINSEQLP